MTFSIALVNITDGSVQGHKAGCADLTRKSRKHADEVWTFDVDSKYDAKASYNADFDEENDGWYEIEWLPCASHVPATVELVEVPELPTVKVGSKWTYIYAPDGTLIAEIMTSQTATVAGVLSSLL